MARDSDHCSVAVRHRLCTSVGASYGERSQRTAFEKFRSYLVVGRLGESLAGRPPLPLRAVLPLWDQLIQRLEVFHTHTHRRHACELGDGHRGHLRRGVHVHGVLGRAGGRRGTLGEV